jgi:hypothetical protein
MGKGTLSLVKNEEHMRVTSPLPLMPKLRMSGSIPPLSSFYAFKAFLGSQRYINLYNISTI